MEGVEDGVDLFSQPVPRVVSVDIGRIVVNEPDAHVLEVGSQLGVVIGVLDDRTASLVTAVVGRVVRLKRRRRCGRAVAQREVLVTVDADGVAGFTVAWGYAGGVIVDGAEGAALVADHCRGSGGGGTRKNGLGGRKAEGTLNIPKRKVMR